MEISIRVRIRTTAFIKLTEGQWRSYPDRKIRSTLYLERSVDSGVTRFISGKPSRSRVPFGFRPNLTAQCQPWRSVTSSIQGQLTGASPGFFAETGLLRVPADAAALKTRRCQSTSPFESRNHSNRLRIEVEPWQKPNSVNNQSPRTPDFPPQFILRIPSQKSQNRRFHQAADCALSIHLHHFDTGKIKQAAEPAACFSNESDHSGLSCGLGSHSSGTASSLFRSKPDSGARIRFGRTTSAFERMQLPCQTCESSSTVRMNLHVPLSRSGKPLSRRTVSKPSNRSPSPPSAQGVRLT